MSSRGGGSTRGRGKQQPQQRQQQQQQQQQPQQRQQQPQQASASASAPAPKVTSFPPLTKSTEVVAESHATPTSSSSIIQATRSTLTSTGDQQTIRQSTLTRSITSDDFVQAQMQSFSLQHIQETASLPPTPAMVKTLGAEFPAKPVQRGTLGRPIRLKTNHFNIKLNKPFTVYQYDVDVTKLFGKEGEKPVIIKSVMKLMFPLLMNKLPAQYKNKIVYNFSKNLYSLLPLPFDVSVTYQFEIEGKNHSVTIKKINEIQVDPKQYEEPLAIQILDLIFTQNFNYSCVGINRSFFKEGLDFYQLGFGLQLWRGAYSSVRPSEVGLTWNVDTANSAFLISQDLLEAATYFYNCNPMQLKQKIESDRQGTEIGFSLMEEFRGREIKTATGGFRKKIQSLGPDSSYQFEWTKPNGQKSKISIKDYMKEHYKIDLKYPQLPCVNLGKMALVPMELCRTELKHQKKLTDKQTADVIKQTAVKATERLSYIQNWINKSSIDKDPILKEFNIDVSLKLVEVDGRVLEAPDIAYSVQNGVSSRKIGEMGSWDHRNFKFNNPVKIEKWVLINYSNRVREQQADDFINILMRVANIHGFQIDEPLDVIDLCRKNREAEVSKSFSDIVTKYKDLALIIVILPGTTRIYNVIKTCGDLEYGIATQAVEDRNVTRINDQTISNILLKINTKLGGRNFVLVQSAQLFKTYLGKFFDTPIMIMGADVTHPAPGDKNVTESIASVVGSYDRNCCSYGARLYAQRSPRGQAYEMIHDLDKMVLSLLETFFRVNKLYPQKIIFYRDGVSEGQFQFVLRHEINKIREACQKINPAYKPAITFIVVQKRHHTRLFAADDRDKKGKSENVPPGTVVDKQITSKNMFDFFLCSHFGIQGTSRPCRYFILHDDLNFSMNQIQLLSYYLCHTYSRCPRSVSYPASAYYAHLAAFRGRDYIRRPQQSNQSANTVVSYEINIHPNIRDKMFFN